MTFWNLLNWGSGTILALAWFSRIVDAAIGMRHVADVSLPQWDRKPTVDGRVPRVSIIVPARNEEADISETLRRLLELDYDHYEVIAINDRSTDRTGEKMDEVAADFGRAAGAPLQVSHIDQLPSGWLGKTHAMWTAAKLAT